MLYVNGNGVPADLATAAKLDRDGGTQRLRSLTVPAWGHVLHRKRCSARFFACNPWYELAAQLGNPPAQYNLASCSPRDRAARRIGETAPDGCKRPRSKVWRQRKQRSASFRPITVKASSSNKPCNCAARLFLVRRLRFKSDVKAAEPSGVPGFGGRDPTELPVDLRQRNMDVRPLA